MEIAADYEISSESKMVTYKKKRGRPKKLSLPLNLTQSNAIVSNNNENHFAAKNYSVSEVDLNKKTKKRGRPRKIFTEQLIADSITPNLQNKTESVKIDSEDHGEISEDGKLPTDQKTNSVVNTNTNSSRKHKKRGRPRKCYVQSDFIESENGFVQSPIANQNVLSGSSETIQTSKCSNSFRKSPRKGYPKKCARYADINSEIENINQIDIDSSEEEVVPKKRRKTMPSDVSESDQEIADKDVIEMPDISISFASNLPSEKSTLSLKQGRVLDTKKFKRLRRLTEEKSKGKLQGEKIIKMGVDGLVNTSLLEISSGLDSPITKSKEAIPDSNLIHCKKIANFQNFKPKRNLWKLLSESEQVQYYPPMIKSAPLRNELTVDVELNCFESTNLDVESRHIAIFTGGPIWGSAWCPTPIDKKAVQYIALATSGNLSEYHSYVSNNKDKSLIQLWNLGYLQSFKLESDPSMQLCIAYNHGTIFDMAWCPSGCWEDPSEMESSDDLARLGLLAVAGSDSFIRIYSVPHPTIMSEDQSNFPLFDACPSLVLKPFYRSSSSTENTACMTICWEKTGYCNRIAGGYGNGLICIWLLNSTSSLLTINDEEKTVAPYLVFQSHGTPVTDLAFTSFSVNKWLISTGFEKEMKFWDLTDTCMPVATVKDGYASNVEWAAQCCGAFVNCHESVSFRAPQFFREIEIESSTAISMDDRNITSTKSSYSELMNAIAVADPSGAITAKLVHAVHNSYKNSSVRFPHRCTYAGKFVVPPLKPVNEDVLNPFADSFMSAVNTISWNPNNQSRFWLFAGGHSGVARLSCTSNLNPENNS